MGLFKIIPFWERSYFFFIVRNWVTVEFCDSGKLSDGNPDHSGLVGFLMSSHYTKVGYLTVSQWPLSRCRPASIDVNLEELGLTPPRLSSAKLGEALSIRGLLETVLFCFVYFWARVSGWPWTLYIKNDLGFLILLPLPPPSKAAVTACVIMPGLCGARDQTLGLLSARQTFYQLSCLPPRDVPWEVFTATQWVVK